MKKCTSCNEEKPLDEFHRHRKAKDGRQTWCKACHIAHKTVINKVTNPERMYVDGKYIPKSHPLHKPGRYKTFGEPWSDVEIKQRTKTGYVYIIYNQAFEGWFKVGCAVDAKDRLNSYQTGTPFRDYKLAFAQYFDDREWAEEEVHKVLKSHEDTVQYFGEWFMTDPSVIRKVILDVKEKETDSRHRDQHSAQYNLGLCN